MGWCVLSWGQWYFWAQTGGQGVGTGSKMTARMVMAMVFSFGCFMAIRIVDCFADNASQGTEKGLRMLLSTFGIIMGLCWEACFTEAINGISEEFHGSKQVLVDVVLTLALSLVVVPAWSWYILTKVMENEGESEQGKDEGLSSLTEDSEDRE